MDRFIVRRRDTDEYIYNYGGSLYSDDINDALILDEGDEELKYYINSPDKFMVYKIEKENF